MCMRISMAHAGLPTLVTPLGSYLEMDSIRTPASVFSADLGLDSD